MSSPDDADLIALARAYVEASNAHDIERIGPMLRPDADYSSSRVGTFAGHDDILTMMRGFFDQYDDASWKTHDWRELGEGGVEFSFVLTAGGTDREGVEKIFFDTQGLIRRIEVAT